MPKALVRRPGPNLAAGLLTHIARQPIDVRLAERQWAAYVAALNVAGWATIEVSPAPECADAVFVEDTVVMFNDLAVITRPGAATRRPETDGTAAAISTLGYEVAYINAPGTLDGGDVLKIGNAVYVGQGGRSNDDGIRQLGVLLRGRGASVVAVPVSKVLHLKSGVTALPDGTVVGYPPLVDDPTVFPSFRPVPEETGAHVVLLGDDQLLMAAGAPATEALYRDLGYLPVPVDISEFQKLEGCVTCLSVRLRDR